MNQNELYMLLVLGMVLFSGGVLMLWQLKRIKELEDEVHQVFQEWVILATAKDKDYTTSRIMAQVAKSNLSAGAPEILVKEKPKANTYSIEQSAG